MVDTLIKLTGYEKAITATCTVQPVCDCYQHALHNVYISICNRWWEDKCLSDMT